MKRIPPLSFIRPVPYPPLRGTFPSRGRLFLSSGESVTFIPISHKSMAFIPDQGTTHPRGSPQSKKQTFHILHHDKKCNHQDRHKETIEELPPERLPILLCRDLEAAMRAILQPHDIRHRATAMRTHLAVPRRILRALLRRQLRQDLHRRIQQPAPTRRAETEHIPLIHPPAPSAAHSILRQRLLQHLMTRRASIPALPHPMPAVRTLCKMRPRRLPAPRLRRMRRL